VSSADFRIAGNGPSTSLPLDCEPDRDIRRATTGSGRSIADGARLAVLARNHRAWIGALMEVITTAGRYPNGSDYESGLSNSDALVTTA